MVKISPKNVSSSNKIFINWPSSLKDASQKADLERDHALPRSCHIMKKGGGKGYIWPQIGPFWRKLAEVG